jgi:acyl-CoA synthetase (AMP-forming)/AMP-acid ligase II
MRLIDYLDKGAMLGEHLPCLTMGAVDLSYAQVQRLSHRVARGLQRSGIAAGDKVAVLSSNDSHAFACVFGLSRAGAVWCPVNPRNEVAENRFVLDAFDCAGLIFHSAYAPMVEKMRAGLPKVRVLVCIDQPCAFAPSLAQWLEGASDEPIDLPTLDDLAMIAGTGGTTGQPKGVMLSGRNLETMSALTLMGYPFEGRPSYLASPADARRRRAVSAGDGARRPRGDHAEARSDGFLALIERQRITHTFLPPTLIYMLLQHENLAATDRRSLQCFWYGAAPISAARLEEALTKIGPVMAQLFGQTEAPMMISMMAPREHFNDDGSVARQRLSSAGRPGPLVQVATMSSEGDLLPRGETGEIVIRGSLVMMGYYKDPEATVEVRRHGWHHTGDIGRIDDDNFLYIVDRAKDMIISGGFNVYSVEVEQALMQHPDVQDSAVIGLPDDKWGEKVVAVLQLHAGRRADPQEILAFVKARIGSVKTPKLVEIWPDLPRSKVGKVLKKDIRAEMLKRATEGAP